MIANDESAPETIGLMEEINAQMDIAVPRTRVIPITRLFQWQCEQLRQKKIYKQFLGYENGLRVYSSDFNAGIKPTGSEYDSDVWQFCKQTLDLDMLERLKKRGRSPTSLALVRERILNFGVGAVCLPKDDDIFFSAFDFVRKQWLAYGKCVPLTFKQAECHITSSSSAGFLSAGFKKGEAIPIFTRWAKKSLQDLVDGKSRVPRFPCMIATRPAIVDRGDYKARGVWVYPFHMTLREARYAEAITALLMKQPTFVGWTVRWMEGSDVLLTSLFGDARCTAFGCDFSKFDESQHRRRIRQSFSILFDMIDTSLMSS
jgi:hypothetical protein